MQSYHDTLNESIQLQIDFNAKAQVQDYVVLDYFRLHDSATPSTVWQHLVSTDRINRNTPITSIRRSISNLAKRKLLTKTNMKQLGLWGRNETYWRMTNAFNS